MRIDRLRPSDRDGRAAAPPRGDFGKGLYLTVAETFAPLVECLLFGTAFGPALNRRAAVRDHAAIVLANLRSFGLGELGCAFAERERLLRFQGPRCRRSRGPSRLIVLPAAGPLSSATVANPALPDRPLSPATPRHRTA